MTQFFKKWQNKQKANIGAWLRTFRLLFIMGIVFSFCSQELNMLKKKKSSYSSSLFCSFSFLTRSNHRSQQALADDIIHAPPMTAWQAPFECLSFTLDHVSP